MIEVVSYLAKVLKSKSNQTWGTALNFTEAVSFKVVSLWLEKKVKKISFFLIKFIFAIYSAKLSSL